MPENQKVPEEIERVKELVNEGRIDDSVEVIAEYLERSEEDNYIDRLENIIEILLSLHGGKTVLRFLIEHQIIDIPSLLKNLSKRDSLLRYSFLLLLKSMCENESDLFLPYAEDLLENEDPNVKEAALQLMVFMAGGEKDIADDSLIQLLGSKLTDEKEFVIEKATQALVALGKKSPSIITKTLSNCAREYSENEELKDNIDDVLKSIVSIEKFEEIVEEEKEEPKEKPTTEEESMEISEKAETKKEVKPEKEEEKKEKKKGEIKKAEKEIKEEEGKILDKELALKKKKLALKKKRLELQAKEKELEEKEIAEKEKALKKKQELIEKEKELSQVELELKEKSIEEKEQQIKKQEAKRLREQIKSMEEENKENNENS
jgi:hypothetical protein